MENTKRNSIILLCLTGATAILTAVAFGDSIMAMAIIGGIAIPVYFFIFSFLFVCFGVRTTFDEMLEKEKEAQAKARERAMEKVMWEEEDEDERHERRKALRRVKLLQRDYPDIWESLLDPDDEYYCSDYIDAEKKKKESDSSDMVFGDYSPSHSHSDSSGSDSSGF